MRVTQRRNRSRSRWSRVLGTVLLLTACRAGPAATPELSSDDRRAIEMALSLRQSFVERAHALRDRVPDSLRARVLLSPQHFVFDGANIVSNDPDLPGLVELARGSTDPLVLAVLVDRCGRRPASPCDDLEMAMRWVAADTQNQVAWLALAEREQAHGAAAAAQAAFLRGAEASVWRDGRLEIGRDLLRVLPKDLSPSERSEALTAIAAIVGASAHSRYGLLTTRCGRADERAACRRMLETIEAGATDLLTLGAVARLSARSGVDETIVARRYARYDALTTGALLADLPDPDRPDADLDRFDRLMEARLERGELAAARANLDAARVSMDDAADRNRRMRLARDARLEQARRAAP